MENLAGSSKAEKWVCECSREGWELQHRMLVDGMREVVRGIIATFLPLPTGALREDRSSLFLGLRSEKSGGKGYKFQQ